MSKPLHILRRECNFLWPGLIQTFVYRCKIMWSEKWADQYMLTGNVFSKMQIMENWCTQLFGDKISGEISWRLKYEEQLWEEHPFKTPGYGSIVYLGIYPSRAHELFEFTIDMNKPYDCCVYESSQGWINVFNNIFVEEPMEYKKELFIEKIPHK